MPILEHPFRARRKHLGLKSKRMAVVVGLSETYWNAIENGARCPPPWQHAPIARALQWETEDVRRAIRRWNRLQQEAAK